jgi:DNA invertase Pin-like site-specific DNA recombinase
MTRTALSNSTAPKAWIYARYSTDHQTQKSIDDQVAECRRYCERMGYVVERVLEDAEITGFIDQRPGYQELLRGVETGALDVIVGENIDRVVRDSEHSARLGKLLEFHDIEFWTIQEGKVGLLQLALKTMMSGEMRRTVAMQAHRGLSGNVAAGKSAGGLSFGYEIARNDRGDRISGELCVVESEAVVVRRIMEEYARGKTPQKIASDLNAEGIASPSGTKWRQNTINGNPQRGTGILNNELYIGVRAWNRLEYRLHPATQKRVSRLRPQEEWIYADVPHLRIADDELWDRVKRRQAGLRSMKRAPKNETGARAPYHSRRPKYLLSGLLFCGCCGGKLTIAGTSRKYYYCQRAKEEGASTCKGMTGLPQDAAEAAVMAGLKRDLMQPKALAEFRAAYAREFSRGNVDLAAEKGVIERQIRTHDKEIENATRAIMAGVNSPSLLDALRKAEANKLALVGRLEGLVETPADLPEDLDRRYATLVRSLETILAMPELVIEAIDVVKTLVERIVVEEQPAGGHILDLHGNLGRMLKASAPDVFHPGSCLCASSLGMVAGVRVNHYLARKNTLMKQQLAAHVAGSGVAQAFQFKAAAACLAWLDLLFGAFDIPGVNEPEVFARSA